jgi:hypothetical protein
MKILRIGLLATVLWIICGFGMQNMNNNEPRGCCHRKPPETIVKKQMDEVNVQKWFQGLSVEQNRNIVEEGAFRAAQKWFEGLKIENQRDVVKELGITIYTSELNKDAPEKPFLTIPWASILKEDDRKKNNVLLCEIYNVAER